MASQGTRKTRRSSIAVTEQVREQDASEIKFSTDHGLLIVRDSRMFQRGQETFCRALATAAARQQDVRSAQVYLGSNTFRLEFTPGRVSEQQMSGRFAQAVRDALSEQERANRADGPKDDWAALAAFPAGRCVSSWEIIHESPDYLKLRNGLLRQDSNLARSTAKELRQTPGIIGARVSPWRRSLRIRYDASQMSSSAVVDTAEAIMRRLLRPQLDQPAGAHEDVQLVATGMRRVYYLVMASGSFTLTIVGLVVPGVPTVPFLMATSYYLVRSSPRLNRMLLHSRFFGPIIEDLQSSGGLRPLNKRKLIALVLAVSVVTILLTLPPLSLLLLISAISGLSVYAIARIPGIPGPREAPGKSMSAPALA